MALAVAAAVLAISLFGLPLAVGVAQYNLDNEHAELERVAARAALSIVDDLSAAVSPVLQDNEPETEIGVYSPDGRLLSGQGPAAPDQVVRRAYDGNVATGDNEHEITVAIPITNKDTVTGVLRAATPRSEVTLRTGLIWLAMAGLAILAVCLTWLVARRMAARLAKPLEELSGAAQVLGDGDFTVRSNRSGITEIDSVGASLDSTAERLGETLDRERAFTANASHQLRTPLAGMRLQLEAALESPDTDLHTAVQGAITAVDRLEGIVNDLLTLTRDTRRTRETLPNLPDLLDEVRASWHGQLALRGRALRVTNRGAPAPFAAEAAMRQILNVLVDNAFTHGSGTVTVTARDAGGTLAIDVADEGHIDTPDPFTRHQPEPDNHGIGLALARSLAEAEDGRLVLSSTNPTTFTLHLLADD
ncbi:HAMP domain-containing sensor histidine kinase [Kibdelosporangium lantanae]